jgi:HD-GYP domain-containing protein (c-di-GMP phosphodiesterase class II)
MIASNRFADYARNYDVEESALARVPQRTFGETAWVRLALRSCAQHLVPAIRSGKPHNVANAIRAIAHAPTPEQVDDVLGAACETMLSEAYATHDTHLISNVANAQSVIGTVVAELRQRAEREAIAPVLLRETVDAYVQMVALVNKRLAERLDAVGNLAARIASAMHLPATALVEIELAGRLHDIGTLSIAGMTYVADAYERHPMVGATFLENVPSLAHLAPIVRSHHERFDGRGYPDGLSGAEIPLAARIIGVAATFVDLVSESPEHERFLPNHACRELMLGSGSKFDPDVVTATLQLLRFRQRTKRSA